MVIGGPLAPNFFYEYLILASTIFSRENYKKLGLTPRECPLSGSGLGYEENAFEKCQKFYIYVL